MEKAGEKARIGIDIGGTFTDVALEIADRRYTSKVLTTPDNPVDACMQGLAVVMMESDIDPADVDVIIHGTTLATNAIIERKGAVTAMVTTDGFRDAIEIGTEGRPEQYDINILKPEPLVPRRRRLTVPERLNRDGKVLLPLKEADLEALLPHLDAAGTEALAIAFIHAYTNPMHEEQARDFFAARRPDWSISLSSEISPEFREFERFSTTCANAYIQPLIASYLTTFDATLKDAGFACPLLLMLSSGGLTTVDIACKYPVRLVESGPAGGAIFACDIAKRLDIDQAVSFDMGGTTAKICLLENGNAQTSRKFEVARVYRFKKDSGLPLRVPVIDLVEIGAGGGSIGHVDGLGRLTVGPESAGSEPGPACYGRGGTAPTVTDANLILGRIDPDGFAGGSMRLDGDAAERAMAAAIGSVMGLENLPAAFGVTEMVCENMASAARVHAIESGKNAEGRTLIAFGGAAPLHACQLAEKLGIERIIVPANAGVGSAVGFLRAPISYEIVQTLYQKLDDFDHALSNRICAAMETEARDYVRLGAGKAELTVRRQAYMRYQGQGHEIAVDVPMEPLDGAAPALLQSLFDAEYLRVFGRSIGTIASGEIVSWSLVVSTAPHAGRTPALAASNGAPAARTRDVFDTTGQATKPFAVVDRRDLGAGAAVTGPAIIVEDETSIVVSSLFDAAMLPSGDVRLERKPETNSAGLA